MAVETHGPMDEATIFLSLSWRVRSRNTRATRLTVVTFSNESACSFSDIIPFSSVRPSRLKMKSTRSHSSLVLFFLVLTQEVYILPGVKFKKKYIIK